MCKQARGTDDTENLRAGPRGTDKLSMDGQGRGRILLTSIAALAAFGPATPALAREDAVPGSRYTSARAAALGDAFLPLADDGASALFYNPAAFGKIRHPAPEPIHISAYGNDNYIGGFDTNFYKLTDLKSYEPNLAAHAGEFRGAGAMVFPNYSMKGFGFGILAQSQVGAKEDADGTIHYRSLYQFIPTFGFGLRLAGGIVRVGYSLQWVNEAVGDMTVPAGTDPLGYNQGLAKGSGLSHTFGIALTLPIIYLPSFNFVARNIANLVFQDYSVVPLVPNAAGTPPTELMSFDGSFSIAPKFAGGTMFNIVGEYRDMTNTSGMSLLGRIALGLEFDIRQSVYLRGGWGSGYPTFGFGVRRPQGELSITRYTEELGTSFRSNGDTRYLLEYAIHAF